MDADKNKHETPQQQTAGEPGSAGATAQKIVERGAEAYGQAEEAARDATHKVSEMYAKAKDYSNENPGKTILIALGIGVGLGLLLGTSSRHSRSGRIARPVVNALSDIALELFR